MLIRFRGLAFFRLLAMTAGVALAGTAHALPPWSPGLDNTVFAPIERFGPRVMLQTVARGLTAPNKGVAAPGDPGHLYIVDQDGIAWRLDLANPDTTSNRTVFLDLKARLVSLGVLGPNTFDERGFLGLAFHPRFASNGLLYTYTSEPVGGVPTFPTTMPVGTTADHQNVIAEWRVGSSGTVEPTSRRELIRVDWPQFNHNGGDLAFGPDGLLYASLGDGGGEDDVDSEPFGGGPIVGHGQGNAQNLAVPLGKLLRIDVDGRNSANGQYGIPPDNPFVGRQGTLPEIFAYGFRNPFRFSFDRKNGALFVGDVGQNDIEELDRVVAGGNFGWNFKEGTLFFNPNGNSPGVATPDPVPGRTAPAGLIDPVAQYDTGHEGHSIIAGFVYRGRALDGELNGHMIFGDFSSSFNFPSGPNDHGRLLHLNANGKGQGLRRIAQFQTVTGNFLGSSVQGFGQDADGELYVMGNILGVPFGTGGVVMKIVPVEARDRGHED